MHVEPAPPSIVTKLWYCYITRRSDIVKEQERLHALSPPDLALLPLQERISQSVLLHFRQEDVSQNLAETS